jgi:hypothetical protein
LEGSLCEGCGAIHLPARAACPACRSLDCRPHRFEGTGSLWSFTELQQVPRGSTPDACRVLGIVRLDEGPLILAQITDVEPQDVSIGMRLQMVTRLVRAHGDEGLRVYGYKFRPAEDPLLISAGPAAGTAGASD